MFSGPSHVGVAQLVGEQPPALSPIMARRLTGQRRSEGRLLGHMFQGRKSIHVPTGDRGEPRVLWL